MLIDLDVRGRSAIIFGGGEESEFKALKLLDAGARVIVVGESFTAGLRSLASSKAVRLIRKRPLDSGIGGLLGRLRPFVVIVATEDRTLDEMVAKTARSKGVLVCVVDTPSLNDFNMPAVARIGEIRVAISTQGLSPAMASLLRKRVERLITKGDVLQVKLQGRLREAAKKRLKDAASRREFAYRVINDEGIRGLLRRERYEEAERLAMEMLQSESSRGRGT